MKTSIKARLSVESDVTGNIPVVYNATDKVWEISLTGQSHESRGRITAYYKQDNGTKVAIGHLDLASYNKQTMKLIIVPINNEYTIDEDALTDTINNIYKSAITNWDVSIVKTPLVVDFEENDNDGLDTDLPGIAAYTKEMRNINNAMEKLPDYDKNAYYLFLIDKSENGDKNGIMPFRRHFGYIFMNDKDNLAKHQPEMYHTIAHELGHGAFCLKHPWTEKGTNEGQTYSIMDYRKDLPNNLLYHYQWDEVHNPKGSLFGGDEEDVSFTTDGHYYTFQMIALLLGYGEELAFKLGQLAEEPDTHVSSEMEMEEKDTWIRSQMQQRYHALTGGYHGVELAATAFALTRQPIKNSYNYLFHRFGDCFAHFNISYDKQGYTTSINLNDYILAIDKHIDNTFMFVSPNEKVSTPYGLQGINKIAGSYYVTENGKVQTCKSREIVTKELIDFLLSADRTIVGGVISQSCLGISLESHYQGIITKLPHAIQNRNVMYGATNQIGCFTLGHSGDGTKPDNIIDRKKLYFLYLDAVIDLLTIMNERTATQQEKNKITQVFKDIIDVVKYSNINRLDGIYSYEIAKIKDPNVKELKFYIPVKYLNYNNLSSLGMAWNIITQISEEKNKICISKIYTQTS